MTRDHIKLVQEGLKGAIAIGSGAPVNLPAGSHIWQVNGGIAEVYLQTATSRTLLATVKEEGHVFSLPDMPDVAFSVTGTSGAELIPTRITEAIREDGDEHGKTLSASVDHWVTSIATLVTSKPDEETANKSWAVNDTGDGRAGERVMSTQGVLWHLISYGQMVQITGRRPDMRGPLALPITGGLWTQLIEDQDISIFSTQQMLQAGRLVQSLAQFNGMLPPLLAAVHKEQEQTALGRLSGIKADIAGSDNANSTGLDAAVDAVKVTAESMGVELKSRLRARVGDFSEIPVLIRRTGLLGRKITMTDRWWRHNQGPLILMDETTGQITSLQWRKGAYARVTSREGAHGRVTRRNAGHFGTQAYAIHAPLPSNVTSLMSLAQHLLPAVARDGIWAILAGAGMGVAGVLVPMATGWVFSDIVPSKLPGLLAAVGLALVAAALFSLLFSAARTMALQRIAGRTGIDLTAAVANKVLRLPVSFFKDYSAGDLNQRIDAIDQMRQLITSVMISALITLTFSFLYLGLLFAFDAWLALLSLGLVLIYVVAIAVARAVQINHIRKAAVQKGKFAGTTYETLAGITKLRVAAAESRAMDRWFEQYQVKRKTLGKIGRISNHFDAFSDAFQTITLLCIFAAAAVFVQQDVPAGLFIGFLVAFGSFQGAFTGFCDSFLSLIAATPMADRARPILESESENTTDRADPGRLISGIEVSGLVFAYGKGGPPVLNGIDLTIKAGEHVAIVGGSGSGKSTLFRLLLGFEEPDRGSITYDGQDLAKLDLSRVRSQIGVVMQTSNLFAGSIFENIRGASDAGLDACLTAAEAAGLADDLALFPMGLHTPIVEGARTLSGGQKQRILIARALAGKPAILFFDEATSALDNATQSVVTKTLDNLGTMRITVAHRLSTVRNADRICVLGEGRILESGSFDELMARDGPFAALARRQLTNT